MGAPKVLQNSVSDCQRLIRVVEVLVSCVVAAFPTCNEGSKGEFFMGMSLQVFQTVEQKLVVVVVACLDEYEPDDELVLQRAGTALSCPDLTLYNSAEYGSHVAQRTDLRMAAQSLLETFID